VTTKQQYDERKAAGLCTKCANPLDCESTTRCSSCYEKFKASKSKTKQKRVDQGICAGCGSEPAIGNSDYCNTCRQQNNQLRALKKEQNTIINYNPINKQCKICDQPPLPNSALCKICFNKAGFTKKEALARYGNKCSHCNQVNADDLRLASTDISEPMEHKGPELYRYVCVSTSVPLQYKIVCHSCYWQENLTYVQMLSKFMTNQYASKKNDPIDITYEVTSEDPTDSGL